LKLTIEIRRKERSQRLVAHVKQEGQCGSKGLLGRRLLTNVESAKEEATRALLFILGDRVKAEIDFEVLC
jgi:hypothetical protein